MVYIRSTDVCVKISNEVACTCSLLYYSHSQNKDNSTNQQPDNVLREVKWNY